MRRYGVVALVLVSSLLACGGKSTDSAKPPASPDGGGGGRAGSGGDFAGSPSASGTTSPPGGATSTSGGGGTSTDPGGCDPNAIDDSCVESCGIDLLNIFSPICVDERWVCAEGFVGLKTCAEQSCAKAQVSCCDAELGSIESAPCVDGIRLECPSGTAALQPGAAACRPPGVTDCGALSGPCSDDALECHNGQRCGTNCTCDSGPDGSLVWVCLSPLC
jgi:hypothetical protein